MRLVFFFVALALLAAPARGDERDDARAAFRRGSQHYKLGEYKEALTDFKAAFRSYEDPSFLYNIAQCERQLGTREEAIREYKMYLAEAADAGNRDDVRAIIARLEQELANQRAAAARLAGPASLPAEKAAPHGNTVVVFTPPPPPKRVPSYKKWWVWTLVGVTAAGAAAAGTAIALTRNQPAPVATTGLGTAHPFN